MRRPAVFFDRDNTLIVGNDYLGDPAGVTLVVGAPAAVATCRRLGYAVVVVSNQSGVARGLFDENAVHAVNRETDRQLLAANAEAVIDRHEYCPHHPKGTADGYAIDCDCRKPKPGMLLRAADAMALDLPGSWLVGDAPRDVEAGQAAGCRTILIIDPTLPPSPAASAELGRPADFVVGSLVEAADVIYQETTRAVARHERKADPVADRMPADDAPVPIPLPLSPPRESEAGPVREPVAHENLSAAFPTPAVALPPAGVDLSRLETTTQQVLLELKKSNDVRHDDFSITKLIAGIAQTLALAALPMAYVLYRNDSSVLIAWLLTAMFLQTFTVALLLMGRN